MYCPNRECPDFETTGRHGEYREGITECPYCGQQLVSMDPASAEPQQEEPIPPPSCGPGCGAPGFPPPEEAGSDLEPIFETSDPTEIPIVRSFLDAQGIPHVVVGEEQFDAFRGSLSPMRFNPRAGVAAFLVPLPYAEIARELLVEIEENPDART